MTMLRRNDGKVGTKTRGIDLNFNNACNLSDASIVLQTHRKEIMLRNI